MNRSSSSFKTDKHQAAHSPNPRIRMERRWEPILTEDKLGLTSGFRTRVLMRSLTVTAGVTFGSDLPDRHGPSKASSTLCGSHRKMVLHSIALKDLGRPIFHSIRQDRSREWLVTPGKSAVPTKNSPGALSCTQRSRLDPDPDRSPLRH